MGSKKSLKTKPAVFGRRTKEFFGIILIAFSIFSCIGLVSYQPIDPTLSQYLFSKENAKGNIVAENNAGIIGAIISDALIRFSGTGSFFFPIIILLFGWNLIRGAKFSGFPFCLASETFLFIAICAFINLAFSQDYYYGDLGIKSGGFLGNIISSNLTRFLNRVGSYIVILTVLFLSILALAPISLKSVFEFLKTLFSLFKNLFLVMVNTLNKTGNYLKDLYFSFQTWREVRRARRHRLRTKRAEPKIVSKTNHIDSTLKIKNKKSKSEEAANFDVQERFEFYDKMGGYHLPPLSLLDNPEHIEGHSKKSDDMLIVNSTILEKKLNDFGIEGKVLQVLPGPVITMYEFEPAPGVKVSKIVNLADDLAMGMRALGVRILAPVPGKAVVGIEVPNLKRDFVYLKEVLAAEEFTKSKRKLLLGLGKDISGLPVITNLAQIPHLLVAGSTGSGKSVGVNSMICSILFKSTPDEVKFIMIDPKMLELSIYDGIPHLIAPVVTNPKKAATALRWAVEEMERRYKLMTEKGVKNIEGYHHFVEEMEKAQKQDRPQEIEKSENKKEEEAEIDKKLPYIVVVIDELADLMLVSGKDVEDSLTRLAQMARAAGIHLLVATQRPSVDVLTGIIKANFPARISFQVSSRVDSRTILDSMGAEKLLGKGDMLFLPPGTSRLSRIHGAMVSEPEIKRVVGFLKKQQKPIYLDDIFRTKAHLEENNKEEECDEKYQEAVAMVAQTGQASISMVQRKLKVGYNRAARMVELMEKEGLVGPSDGVKPRSVYVKNF